MRGARHDGAEHVVAADHHDLIDAGFSRFFARHVDRLLEAAGHHRTGRDKAAFRESTILARWSSGRPKRLEGAPAHEHGLAERHLAELLEVGAQPPRKIAAPADGAVLGPGDDKRDDRLADRPPLLQAHTATLAWKRRMRVVAEELEILIDEVEAATAPRD